MNISDHDLVNIEKRQNIVIFDGICHLCERSVLFIINRDPQKLFSFCSAQSAVGMYLQQKYQINALEDETVILIADGVVFERSNAIFEITKRLGGKWRWVRLLKYIPVFIRDFIYKKIAQNRYVLFGKANQCLLPSHDISDRFI
ncbi:DCC1-like thiol-disulfide oxidoreductase family protein [Photobacterium sp. S4TG1]|uniref:thiol-disulfide oxidoreductase DCC family protein n=1 Tax=Photobacterium sp. S4TG1 TaxID=3114587 RepID=UPI002E176E14|nr:DCC1-like thiol-disulfide oxidoreductase family protein [Photobacterium sp. S4TG1]